MLRTFKSRKFWLIKVVPTWKKFEKRCTIKYFRKYREFVRIHIKANIVRIGQNLWKRLMYIFLTRQSKTNNFGICDPEIQSKNFLHANHMHSPFSWMFVPSSNHPLEMWSHLNMKKSYAFKPVSVHTQWIPPTPSWYNKDTTPYSGHPH
jgi:hypothetical protein